MLSEHQLAEMEEEAAKRVPTFVLDIPCGVFDGSQECGKVPTRMVTAEYRQGHAELPICADCYGSTPQIEAHTQILAVAAEVRRCWAALYPHRLYTFYQPSTGVAMPLCFYCNRYETSGYCAERHRRGAQEG